MWASGVRLSALAAGFSRRDERMHSAGSELSAGTMNRAPRFARGSVWVRDSFKLCGATGRNDHSLTLVVLF